MRLYTLARSIIHQRKVLSPMSKRAYKFTSADHGISNLQNTRRNFQRLTTARFTCARSILLTRFGEVNGPTLQPALRS